MDNIKPPKVPEPHTVMLTKEQTKALLALCAGKDFTSRRDTAIILLLADTGMRRSELTNLTTEDLDLRARLVAVEGRATPAIGRGTGRSRLGCEPPRRWTGTCGLAVSIPAPSSCGCGCRRRAGSPRTASAKCWNVAATPSGSTCTRTCSGTASPTRG
jgi:hypothetical protein